MLVQEGASRQLVTSEGEVPTGGSHVPENMEGHKQWEVADGEKRE